MMQQRSVRTKIPFRLKQPQWLKSWLMPRSSKPVERFVETVLRGYLPVGLFFMMLALPGTLLYEPNALQNLGQALYNEGGWLTLISTLLVLHLLDILALRRNNLHVAVRWMMAIYFTVIFSVLLISLPGDPTPTIAFMVLLLVCSMSVPNRNLIPAIIVGTDMLIAIATVFYGAGASADSRISSTGAFISLAGPLSFWGLVLFLLRREIDTHLLDLDGARLKAESASLRAESASRVKSEFLATVSHDLRTPLNNIISLTQMVLQGVEGVLPKPLPAQVLYLEYVEEAGQALVNQFEQMMDFSRLEIQTSQPSLKPMSGNEIIQMGSVVRGLVEKKGLKFEVSVNPSMSVTSDPERLRAIISNLLSNAVAKTETGTIRLSAEVSEDSWKLEVSDTGVGIAADQLPRIFDEFYQITPDHRGVGLGLTIVDRNVKALGGKIEVSSTVGVGTTFKISFRTPKGSIASDLPAANPASLHAEASSLPVVEKLPVS